MSNTFPKYSLSDDFRLFYWREGQDEIDFVLEKRGQVVGLEIKTSASGYHTGMAAFKKSFQPQKVLLVGDSGLPWQEFLSMNPETLF